MALQPNRNIEQYAHASWRIQDGQLPGMLYAVAQTRDGNLWVGTEFGLLRFDGTRFLPWQPPQGQHLPDEYITALAASHDGSLWIGTRTGISHWNAGALESYRTSKGPTGPGVAAILEDHSGTVWIGTAGYKSGELCRVESRSLRCYGPAKGQPGNGVLSIFESRSGELWAGGIGGVSALRQGVLEFFPAASGGTVESFAEDDAGRPLVSTGKQDGLNQIVAGRLVPYPLPPGNDGVRPRQLLRDRDGGIWMGTRAQGLLHLYQGRVDRFTQAEGLSGDDVHSLFEDREGNVWVATGGGLDRFRDYAVTTVSTHEGLSSNIVSSVFASKTGAVWIGTDSGLNRIEGANVRVFTRRDGLPANGIMAIFEDRSGHLWVDTYGGLAYYNGTRFDVAPVPLARNMGRITAAVEDRDGTLWFTAEHGLLAVPHDRAAHMVPWPEFGGRQAFAMEADFSGGGIWLGFRDGRLAHYGPAQTIEWHGGAEGLGHGLISDLHAGRDQTLWIATEKGLARLRDGVVHTLTITNDPLCNRIRAIAEDRSGGLWLDTACGLVVVSASDLTGWSLDSSKKVYPRIYNYQDGMVSHPTTGGYFRRAARSNDGRLWFAVLKGVAVSDPGRIPANPVPPPVEIEEVRADRKAFSVSSGLTLPALTRELEIDYAALSLVAPEKVLFRYRLEGFDRDWKNVGARRQAIYTNLPPRHYQFKVIACNNDGIWNNEGASLDFVIAPAFYQTGWFYALCGGCLFSLGYTASRLRVRYVANKLKMTFEATLAERNRIARELHDTLLQNISGFALQLDALMKTVVQDPHAATGILRELRKQAEEWLRETRESVLDLRANASGGQDLVAALRAAGGQIISGSAVGFRIGATGKQQAVPAALQDQLVRIEQEAVRNALRHGGPTDIRVQVAFMRGKRIRMQIRDDGSGFDLEQAWQKNGHYGLATMQERAKQVGGEFRISSQPGSGTEIEVIAPIANHRTQGH